MSELFTLLNRDVLKTSVCQNSDCGFISHVNSWTEIIAKTSTQHILVVIGEYERVIIPYSLEFAT